MYDQTLFSVVFLSQILLLSFFLPRQVLERMRYVVKNYPPDRYPRLYPVTLDRAERAQRAYRNLNFVMLALGLALLGYGFWSPGEEWLGWDTKTLVFLYYMAQWSPLLVAVTGGFTYFNLKRKPDDRRQRRATLRRRRLTDYVSPKLLGTAAMVYLAFIGFVGYVRTFDFPWFGGWLNVAGITAMNAFFAVLIAYAMYGKKKDPYMADEDRDRAIERSVTLLVFISVAATVYITLSIGLSALDLRNLSPVAQSLYFQLISVAAFRGFRIDDVNFEVYREDPVTT